VTIPVLRKLVAKDYVNRLWNAAADAAKGHCTCPMCNNAMATVQQLTAGQGGEGAIEIDVCRPCHAVWFDTHEIDAVTSGAPAPPPPSAKAGRELSPRAREVLAMAEIEAIRRRADASDDESTPPDEGWQTVLAVFGFPVEENAPLINRWPFVTWGTAFLMTLATAWALSFGGPDVFKNWGLIPTTALRDHGLTLVTSFFLHGSLMHLLSNAVFLLMFGDNVEDFLGHARFLLLLVGASLAGDSLHIAFEPHQNLPLIGASGGISGVIVFYALQFPHARMVQMFRWWFSVRWIRYPAWAAALFWVGLQLLGLFEQIHGLSNVSALAHLGGAAFGAGFWFLSREGKGMREQVSI